MSRDKRYQYFVEGKTEKKLIEEFKKENTLIIPGVVNIFNVVEKKFSSMILSNIPNGTTVILIFDTDKKEIDTLKENILKLRKCKTVKDIWCVMQVDNLEDELIRATDIRKIKDLIGCRSDKDFKRDFLKEKRLIIKLNNHNFNIDKLWSSKPSSEYNGIDNMGNRKKKKK